MVSGIVLAVGIVEAHALVYQGPVLVGAAAGELKIDAGEAGTELSHTIDGLVAGTAYDIYLICETSDSGGDDDGDDCSHRAVPRASRKDHQWRQSVLSLLLGPTRKVVARLRFVTPRARCHKP